MSSENICPPRCCRISFLFLGGTLEPAMSLTIFRCLSSFLLCASDKRNLFNSRLFSRYLRALIAPGEARCKRPLSCELLARANLLKNLKCFFTMPRLVDFFLLFTLRGPPAPRCFLLRMLLGGRAISFLKNVLEVRLPFRLI